MSQVEPEPGDKPVESVDNSVTEGDQNGRDGSGSGSDLARQALEAARQKRAAAGTAGPGTARSGLRPRSGRGGRSRGGWSGSGADARDPQPLGRLASRVARQRGWQDQLAGASVFGRWSQLVGPELAQHATPVSLREGELVIRASSTAWATQLRLLQRQLLTNFGSALGPRVVQRIRVHGPAAPSWRKGPRHISGRGPRDTYG